MEAPLKTLQLWQQVIAPPQLGAATPELAEARQALRASPAAMSALESLLVRRYATLAATAAATPDQAAWHLAQAACLAELTRDLYADPPRRAPVKEKY